LTGRHRYPRGANIDENTFFEKGLAVVLFVEGHVEAVAPKIGRDQEYYDPIYLEQGF
jgi:hypothetical protein